jgi:hypothetical protein
MSDTSSRVETLSDRHPDAERVGPHLVIDKTDWVPGQNPDPHRGHPEQTEYLEHFYRCTLCGVEVLQKRDLPETCEEVNR